MNIMKIIHYIPSIDRMAGGISTYMQVLAKPLGTMAEVHIMTHASENPLPMENCKVHDIPRYRPFSGVWKKAVVDLLDSVRPDIVHVNCCWTPDCAMIQRLAQKRGYKVVLTPHGMLEPWIIKRHYWTRKVPALWLYQKAAVQRADCVQATAESERDNLLKLGYNSNIKVVRLGIDAESIEMKRSWKKSRQILFLSRVHVKKGINFLVEAADVLRNELQGYKILVAGEGEADYVEDMKRMICDRGLQDIVQIIGGVYGDEKWRLFQTSDFFVLPTHSENFGLAIAESLASGTPVITTVGTPWSDLNSSEAGAWIEIGTEPLVETLRRFLCLKEDELETMGRNGRKLIETKYSAHVMAEQMMEVYKSV
jgi:glycosyltransferase involved in cell wall biosynthesis